MSVIDDYLSNLTKPQRAALERVRQIVTQTVPDAEEVITYGMPGFKYQGKYLFAFAAFKDHLSIFPGGTVSQLKDKLGDYKISKGTVQFSAEKPVPEQIIKALLSLRLADINNK